MKITFADGVSTELVNLASFIAQDNKEAAERFLKACEKAFRFLAEIPLIGSVRKFQHTKLAKVRIWRIKGFEKHLIIYLPLKNGVKILHVFHSARDYNRLFEIEYYNLFGK